MATERFTRARHATNITANGGTYTLDYSLAADKQLQIIELFASSDTDAVKIEVLYTDDNGITWTNPFDSGSSHVLLLYVAGYIPVSGQPEATWYTGGSQVKLRIKITNNHPTQNANVFYLVKGLEKDV